MTGNCNTCKQGNVVGMGVHMCGKDGGWLTLRVCDFCGIVEGLFNKMPKGQEYNFEGKSKFKGEVIIT